VRDAAQLVRDYRQAEKSAARAREVLDVLGRGAVLRRTMLGDLVRQEWPNPLPEVSRQARETVATAERAATMRLAMLAELVGRDQAAAMAGVSRQTVNNACRVMGATPPPDDEYPVPPASRRRRWLGRGTT
jgi:hypothetical protein